MPTNNAFLIQLLPLFQSGFYEFINNPYNPNNPINGYNNFNNLYTIRYSKKTQHEVNDSLCVICHEQFKPNNSIIKLDCKHTFHKKCLKSWFKSNITCPICRHSQQ